MAGGLGMLGYIGFGRENSGGIAVAPTHYFQALSESLSFEFDRYELSNMAGQITEPDDRYGVGRVEGDIEAVFDPQIHGHILKAALGSGSVASLGGGFFRHDFTPPQQSQWDNRFALQPMTFDIFRDVGSTQAYFGVNVNRIELSIEPSQALQFTADVIGTGMTNRAPSTSSFHVLTPFTYDTASVSIGGLPDTDVEAFNLVLDNGLEGIATLSNFGGIRKIRRTDFVMPSMTMTMGFEDISELAKYIQQTETDMAINITQGSFAINISMPRIVYTSFPTGVGGRGRQTVDIDAKLRHHQGSGHAFKISLITNVGSI